MFYKKSGLPEQGEIVICTVTKILYHSVFAKLDEYKNRDGMIHISEISPGRIRNIRDYVKEGKKIVCKVLNVNLDKGQIDLSIRRVNTMQKINKSNDYKQEQKAEKLLDYIGKQLKKDLKTMYEEAGYKLIENYGSLYDAFQSFVLDDEEIQGLKLEKELEKLLLKIVQEKIKAPEVEIKGTLKLSSEAANGVEIIKNILIKAQKGDIKINYIGAPKYKISVKASDYKTAEGIIKNAQEEVVNSLIKAGGSAEFIKSK
jgi:translation initiation factor 2 subunit 1